MKAIVQDTYGPPERLFTNPRDRRTEDYITGRFG